MKFSHRLLVASQELLGCRLFLALHRRSSSIYLTENTLQTVLLGYATIKAVNKCKNCEKLDFFLHLHAHFPTVSGVSFLYFQGLKHPLLTLLAF